MSTWLTGIRGLLDRLDMVGMDAGGLGRVIEGQAAILALPGEVPAGLAGGIDGGVGLGPAHGSGVLGGGLELDLGGIIVVHGGTLGRTTG